MNRTTRLRPVFPATLVGLALALFLGAAAPAARGQSIFQPDQPKVEDKRLPIPEGPAVAEAEKIVKDLFKLLYADTSPDGQQALAVRLIITSRERDTDATQRYVLLREARDLATAAGNALLMENTANLLARTYRLDSLEQRVTLLPALARNARTPEAQRDLTQVALGAVDDAMDKDDYDLANRLVTVATTAAAKSRNTAITNLARARVADLAVVRKEALRIKPFSDTLITKPDAPEAAGEVGRFLCLLKDQWSRGLPLLAKGQHAGLKEAAAKDLANPAKPDEQLALADAWWALAAAEKDAGLPPARLTERARHWYRQAMPNLTGLNRAKVAQRLAGRGALPVGDLLLESGLPGAYFPRNRADRDKPLLVRVDPRPQFEWLKGVVPGRNVPADSFSIRYVGYLKALTTGDYLLKIESHGGVSLTINERLVLQSRGGGGMTTIALLRGYNSVVLDFSSAGDGGKLALHWSTTGEKNLVPIPAELFFHTADQIPAGPRE